MDLIFEKELLDNGYVCGKRMTDLGTRKRKEINRGGGVFPESITVGQIKAWPWQVAAGVEQTAREEQIQGWVSARASGTPPLDSVRMLGWVGMEAGAKVEVNTARPLNFRTYNPPCNTDYALSNPQ